jgi:PAS domain S-box-containing protein
MNMHGTPGDMLGADWDPQELLRAVFQALPLGICITDQDGILVYVNEAYCRIYGYESQELLGKSFLVVVPEENHAALQELHDKFIHEGRDEIPSHWELVRSDGTVISVSATAARFRDRLGRTYKVTTVLDVTDKVRLERMREDAERIVRHDLKNPLNGILGSVQLLLELSRMADQEREFCGYIYESGKRMLDLIDHSMDLFRLEEGTYELSPQECDLAEVLRTICTEFRFLAERRELRCEHALDGRRLRDADTVPIIAEKALLETMLGNLVKNAMEASPQGGTIRIGLETGADAHTVSIHNAGVVPDEIRDNFFDRYVTCGKQGGTGLGTWSAWLAARAHGGDIDMATSQEAGTTLTITLPRAAGVTS